MESQQLNNNYTDSFPQYSKLRIFRSVRNPAERLLSLLSPFFHPYARNNSKPTDGFS
jgi:hypothetical protein